MENQPAEAEGAFPFKDGNEFDDLRMRQFLPRDTNDTGAKDHYTLPTDRPFEDPPDELGTNGFMRLNTHDTSFTGEHVPKIETFAVDLQAAVNAVWPSRYRGRYGEVHVLLMSWEDDNLGVETEIRRLGNVFSNLYQFEVREFRIPRKTPGKATTKEVSKFLENDGSGNLLVVYYAGHARLSNQANDPAIWTATDLPKSPALPSGGVQQLLEEAESDVLLLYDCCHSSHPAINVSGQGVTEVIAACGFETQAPAVGPHSFTNALIRELEEGFAGPPLSVAELHSRMIGSLKYWRPDLLRDELGNVWTDLDGRPKRECHKRRTPVHCFLTNETPYRSIMLSPLRAKLSYAAIDTLELSTLSDSSTSGPQDGVYLDGSSEEAASSAPTSIPEADPTDSLQVLLAVRLEEDFFDCDYTNKVRTWCEWLRNIPQGTRDVKVQGVYRSLSTLIIISMPATVWNLLPNNGAYSFIGFVRSDNLAAGLHQDGNLMPSEQNMMKSENLAQEEHRPAESIFRGSEPGIFNPTISGSPIRGLSSHVQALRTEDSGFHSQDAHDTEYVGETEQENETSVMKGKDSTLNQPRELKMGSIQGRSKNDGVFKLRESIDTQYLKSLDLI